MSQSEIVKLWIRLPADDKRRLETEAERNCRSLTAEITYVLRTSLDEKARGQREKAAG